MGFHPTQLLQNRNLPNFSYRKTHFPLAASDLTPCLLLLSSCGVSVLLPEGCTNASWALLSFFLIFLFVSTGFGFHLEFRVFKSQHLCHFLHQFSFMQLSFKEIDQNHARYNPTSQLLLGPDTDSDRSQTQRLRILSLSGGQKAFKLDMMAHSHNSRTWEAGRMQKIVIIF